MTYNEKKIARLYAAAFLDMYGKMVTKQSLSALARCVDFFLQHAQELYVVHSAGLSFSKKYEAVASVFATYKGELFLPVVSFLLHHKRICLLPLVLQCVRKLWLDQHDIIEFEVAAPVELSSDLWDSIQQFLSLKTGKQVFLYFLKDESLIAGISLKSDCFMWEFSVRKELARLKDVV